MIKVIKRFIRIPHSTDSPPSSSSSEQKLCASPAVYMTPYVLIDESELQGAKADYSHSAIIDIPQMKLLGDYKETFMILKNLFSINPKNPIFFDKNMVIVPAVVVIVSDSLNPDCRQLIESVYETEQILKWDLVKSYLGPEDKDSVRSSGDICWYILQMRNADMNNSKDSLASYGYKLNSRYFAFLRMVALRQRPAEFLKIFVQVFQLAWIYNNPLYLSFISRCIDLFTNTISTKQLNQISKYFAGPPSQDRASKLPQIWSNMFVNLIKPIGTYVKSVIPQFTNSHVILDNEFETDAQIQLREKLSDLTIMRGELLLQDERYRGKLKKTLSTALSETPPVPGFVEQQKSGSSDDGSDSAKVKKRKRKSSSAQETSNQETDNDPTTTETIFMEGVTDYRTTNVTRNSIASAENGLSRPFAKRSPNSKLPLYPDHVKWCRSVSDEQSILNALQTCNETQTNKENVLILLDAAEKFDLKSFLMRAFELNPNVTVLSIGESRHTLCTTSFQAKGGFIQISTLTPSIIMDNLAAFTELQDRSVRQYLTFLFKLLKVKHAIITGDFINVVLIAKSRPDNDNKMYISVCTQSEVDYHNFATQLL